MLRSTERILTSHVGSLIRPLEVMQLMQAKDRGEPYDERAAAALLDQAVAGVVRRQAEAGLDIVNDGEFGKNSFLGYIWNRLAGLEMRNNAQTFFGRNSRLPGYKMHAAVAREREEFADFYQGVGPDRDDDVVAAGDQGRSAAGPADRSAGLHRADQLPRHGASSRPSSRGSRPRWPESTWPASSFPWRRRRCARSAYA